jgi:hypothetical protein
VISYFKKEASADPRAFLFKNGIFWSIYIPNYMANNQVNTLVKQFNEEEDLSWLKNIPESPGYTLHVTDDEKEEEESGDLSWLKNIPESPGYTLHVTDDEKEEYSTPVTAPVIEVLLNRINQLEKQLGIYAPAKIRNKLYKEKQEFVKLFENTK